MKDLNVSMLGAGRTRVDIEVGRFAGLCLKTRHMQVYRFGPQNQEHIQCDWMAVMEVTWRHLEICIETK